MISKQQTPKIRLTGFSEDWVEQKLGDVLKIKSGLSQKEIEVADGIYPILATGGEIGRTNTALYSKESVLIGRKGTIDKPYYMTTPFWTVDTLFYSELSERVSGLFIFTLFQKIQWRKLDTSTGVPSLTSSTIHNIIANFPTKTEQTAIGKLFQNVDQTIALQRRKHEQTQMLKKSLLSKMFPQKGHSQPEIRLNGFSGDWVESKFFDNIESIIDFRGRTPKKIGLEWSEKGYLALSALNVKNGYIDFNLDKHFGNEELYQKWMGGKELVVGQVLFTTEAPMGNVAQVPDNRGYILSQRTIAFNIRKELLTDDFLAILLRSPVTFNMLESMSSGGTAKGVSQKSLTNLQVVTPQQLEEQTAIGQFFKRLDDTISIQAKQLKTLDNLKQALLAKMFV
ncbi:restriction endonuclease subunit S [Psychrobacter sp. 16-MNA-CIBAN-0192]|uniref:restriction endonuclease subunit S n=1 Tax=Psychrobacter sp. 16-MNA-CIBAN-0192 TaxID=3140448 RepID=UPI003329D3CE